MTRAQGDALSRPRPSLAASLTDFRDDNHDERLVEGVLGQRRRGGGARKLPSSGLVSAIVGWSVMEKKEEEMMWRDGKLTGREG